jgi:hypothetical protein
MHLDEMLKHPGAFGIAFSMIAAFLASLVLRIKAANELDKMKD